MAVNSLGIHAEIVMGQSPRGEKCNSVGRGLPLLNGPTEFGPRHPIPVQFTTDPRKRALPGDILFCVRGSTTGRMNWADREYAIGRGVAAIRHKRNSELQPLVRAIIEFGLPGLLIQATGSTFPNVSASQLADLWWPTLDEKEQRTISHILGTIDDKIELNRRMNETLEGMARAIFKSWFVDFDPVHAKAGGRPTGLPPDIEALFPDSFQDSELGEIPKGWGVGTIKENCTKIHNGGTPNRKESQFWEPASIPWLTSGEVRQNIIIETENFISELGLKHSSAKWLPADSTVVALYGATAGQVSITTTKLTTNQAICGLVPKKDYRYFNHIHMANSSVSIANLARGSAQQNISKGIVEATITVLPNSPIIRVFDKVVCEIYKKLKSNLHENLHITAIRDTLLPKLISGELRVPNTERIVEGCV